MHRLLKLYIGRRYRLCFNTQVIYNILSLYILISYLSESFLSFLQFFFLNTFWNSKSLSPNDKFLQATNLWSWRSAFMEVEESVYQLGEIIGLAWRYVGDWLGSDPWEQLSWELCWLLGCFSGASQKSLTRNATITDDGCPPVKGGSQSSPSNRTLWLYTTARYWRGEERRKRPPCSFLSMDTDLSHVTSTESSMIPPPLSCEPTLQAPGAKRKSM